MLDITLQRFASKGYSAARVTRPFGVPPRRPRVSIVVPCHNYGRFLPSCLGSVLAQEVVDLDVLVVDDASTDGSAEVAHSIAATDERVRVHRNVERLGHIATYNVGFSQVTGEYVMLLSADDMLTPGALFRAVRLMAAYPSVGFTYGWSLAFFGDDLPEARTRTRSWSVWQGLDWVEDRCRRGSNAIRSSDALVRRNVLEKVGGYREDLPHSGDLEWWLRAAMVADVGMVCGVDQMYYRLHGANMSRTTYASTLTNLYETRKAFDAVLAGPADLSELLRTVHKKLARKALEFAIAEYMSGADGSVSLEGYREFALAADPQVVESKEWRALRRREAVGMDRARTAPAFRAREVLRDLEGRVDWRRWRFSGI